MSDLYKIGTVAKRTGISPERLRAWERRYGLEPAERAGQTRFYSAEQLDQLTAIKGLLDQGHPISQVIGLDAAELKRRLHPPRLSPQARLQPQGRRGRFGLVGSQLIHALRTADDPELTPTMEWASLAELEAYQEALPRLDVVAELRTHNLLNYWRKCILQPSRRSVSVRHRRGPRAIQGVRLCVAALAGKLGSCREAGGSQPSTAADGLSRTHLR